MNANKFKHEAKLGGPGLDGYAYRADCYCVDCAHKIIDKIASDIAPKLESTADPLFSDSGTVPCPIFFGEHDDCSIHCAECGEYLYGQDSEEIT